MSHHQVTPIVPYLRYVDPATLDVGNPADFAALTEAYRREARLRDWQQVRVLLAAKWSFELPASPDPDLMSWYWRSPPKRGRSRGRLYLSTDQAFNALLKMTPKG